MSGTLFDTPPVVRPSLRDAWDFSEMVPGNRRPGRPPSCEYAEEIFVRHFAEWMRDTGFGPRDVELLSGVNRGSVGQIWLGKRRCSEPVLRKLMSVAGFAPELAASILPTWVDSSQARLVLLDPPVAAAKELQRGQEFLIRTFYGRAKEEFVRVLLAARRDLILRADAAGRMAWLQFERGDYATAKQWIGAAFRTIETHFAVSINEIVASAQLNARCTVLCANDDASLVLSRCLHIHTKIITEQILYGGETGRRSEAIGAFHRSLAIDGFLQVPHQLGHDYRWQAVSIAAYDLSGGRDAANLLSASAEKFERQSLGEAYLARDRAIVGWQMDRTSRLEAALLDAVERLASFAEARALGPTYYVLNRINLRNGGSTIHGLRYALMSGCFHPWGYFLRNAVEQLATAGDSDLRRELDALRAGNGPYGVIHRVMSRLATDATPTATSTLIERNLDRLLGKRYAQLSSASRPLRPPMTLQIGK